MWPLLMQWIFRDQIVQHECQNSWYFWQSLENRRSQDVSLKWDGHRVIWTKDWKSLGETWLPLFAASPSFVRHSEALLAFCLWLHSFDSGIFILPCRSFVGPPFKLCPGVWAVHVHWSFKASFLSILKGLASHCKAETTFTFHFSKYYCFRKHLTMTK